MDGQSQHKAFGQLEEVFERWELEGAPRRDCISHRAPFLRQLAWLSLLLGGLTFACLIPCFFGIPLGALAWVMARRDSDQIRAGHMDQAGYHPTEKARANALEALFLNLFALLFWCVLTGLLFLVSFGQPGRLVHWYF